MKIKNTKILIPIFFLVILSIPITPSNAVIPPVIPEIPNREEVVWTTGAYTNLSSLNPWREFPDPWAILMFEPLFGKNTLTKEVIPCIGEEYAWLSVGTELHIKINPEAKWSNGRQINATDVYFSYLLAANQTQWKTNFPIRFTSYNIENATGVSFEMTLGYEYSKKAIDWISTNIPILPWYEVYKEVNATYDIDGSGNLSLFTNDWWDPAFNEDWKVCSGPYAPVYRNTAQTATIYQRRHDWWGNTSTFELYPDLPNWDAPNHPEYVGHLKIELNYQKDTAFLAGLVDLHAGDYYDMWNDIGRNNFLTYSNGWYGQYPPYQAALGNPLNVAFNHEYGAPLNLSWFREAMAWMINYDLIPEVATFEYIRRSEPTFLDSLSPVHAPYFNDSLAIQYRRRYNLTKAAEILLANGCTGSIGNAWYLPAQYGGGEIGPFTMICPRGWIVERIFTEFVCIDFTNFGIPVYCESVNTGTPEEWDSWVSRWVDRDYELGMSGGEPKVIESPEVFFNAWRDDKDWNSNITGWYSPQTQEFNTLYEQLECETDPILYQYLLDEIQRIFCEEIPEIPCFINLYWYTYSEFYWEGWNNANTPFQQICTESTNDQFVAKHRMILNLISTGRELNSPTWVDEPTDQTIEYGENFIYDVEATDDSGTVYYMINDTDNFLINPNTGLITNNTILVEGLKYLNITAYDPSNNDIQKIITITVLPLDTTPPAWVEEPTDQTIEYGENFIYDVDAIDDSGTVYYMINASANFQIDPLSGIIINNTILKLGTYYLEITAYDPSDNDIQSVIKITVSADTDNIPGYDLVILITGMFISIIVIGSYKKKNFY